MRWTSRRRGPPRRSRLLVSTIAVGAVTAVALPAVALAQEPPPPTVATVVLQETLLGDLVMAGNSNVVRAGQWSSAGAAAADVDGDVSRLCLARQGGGRALCADNSSSAALDLPAGATVVAARLYVLTSVGESRVPMRVRFVGPAGGPSTVLGGSTAGVPKVAESTGVDRQVTWDVTELVRAGGGGTYTVADIVSERAGPWRPYASWSLVVAYRLADGVDLATLPPEAQPRFARRTVSWQDGFVVPEGAPVAVELGGFTVPATPAVFAKSFHVVAHAGRANYENLLFDGGPLGLNTTPGDAPPPAGVVLGAEPACNSIVDVLNDSVCLLGTAVTTKTPGAADYRAGADGTIPTSGSSVDMDVLRIPDRYLVAGQTSAVLSVVPTGDGVAVPAMLAVSIDQPQVAP